jgi:hypothetical protein
MPVAKKYPVLSEEALNAVFSICDIITGFTVVAAV